MESYPTPHALVEALHARQGRARRQLHQLLRAPVGRLMGELVARHRLAADADMLVVNALHLAEVVLRVRPTADFANQSWSAFRAALLVQLAKLALEPFGAVEDALDPPSLPESAAYHSETFFRPHGRVGQRAFGGDWYAGHSLEDGSLWVFLADVTGHGYYAYLLATALPAVWERLWAAHPRTAPEPCEMLAALHALLADCLPDGIYLECTLVRLTTEGKATVAPAGGVRLLVHPARSRPDVVRLRSAWIGLRPPTAEEQYRLSLGHGDELVLATDGIFEQLDEHGGAEAVTQRVSGGRGSLFPALRRAVEEAIATGEQRDDMTMVLLRRRERGDVVLLPFPAARGQGDVPV